MICSHYKSILVEFLITGQAKFCLEFHPAVVLKGLLPFMGSHATQQKQPQCQLSQLTPSFGPCGRQRTLDASGHVGVDRMCQLWINWSWFGQKYYENALKNWKIAKFCESNAFDAFDFDAKGDLGHFFSVFPSGFAPPSSAFQPQCLQGPLGSRHHILGFDLQFSKARPKRPDAQGPSHLAAGADGCRHPCWQQIHQVRLPI